MTSLTTKELVAEATKHIETISADKAVKRIGNQDTVFVDLREPEELHKIGRIPGALNVPRGLLEFQVDPASPMHKPELSGKKLVLFCGSGSRSALAAKSLKDMRVDGVVHVAGGFPALQKAGAVTT
jgi:rhodanese-related sulfurtransferase